VSDVAWSLAGDTDLKPALLIFFVLGAVACRLRCLVLLLYQLATIAAFVSLTATLASLHSFFGIWESRR
jgi:hypothetical protein